MEEAEVIKIIANILEEWAENYTVTARENLIRKKGRATGALLESINYNIETKSSIISLHINMADYAKFVNDGRGPGKAPPRKAIEDWIKVRGISMKKKPSKGITREREIKTLAFLIGRKIATYGTKAKKFLPTVQTSLLRERIAKELKLYLTVDLVTEVKKIIER